MSTKSKSKKKNGKKSYVSRDSNWPADADPTWFESQIVPGKTNRGLKLLKFLGGQHNLGKSGSPLGWLLNPAVSAATQKQVETWHVSLLKKSDRVQIADEIILATNRVADDPLGYDDAIIGLAVTHAVRALIGYCEYWQWQNLVARILEMSRVAESNVSLAPDIFQQLAIEVPIMLAFQVPEVEHYVGLASKNCQKMGSMISDMLDHDGWPHSRYNTCFGPLVASWVRCYAVIPKLDVEPGFEAASQLEWMVRQVLRMLRPDGTLVFSDPRSNPMSEPCLELLLRLSSDPEDEQLLKTITSKKRSSGSSKDLPAPSNLSEWSESALLQSHWGRNSPTIAVDFSQTGMLTEIFHKVGLIQGEIMPVISINGVEMTVSEPFEVACIESDDDLDYLELERDLGKGVFLTRQILLSRSEEFLLVADVIVPRSASRIDYRCGWPLAAGVEGMHESETREVYLTRDKKIHSLVLPLALPEWKTGRTDDHLVFQEGRMCLNQGIDGLGLYVPLFFDLSPQRSMKKRTWRQVTVAENMNKVARDVACAYRVQLDKQQWIFYRIVSSLGNRTFMGENVSSEFFLGRFSRNGKVKQLIEIE